VDMVFHSVDPVQMTSFLCQKIMDVNKKSAFLIVDHCRFSVFCCIHEMVKNLCVGTHKKLF
jgi:hypothetical protein